MSLRSARSMLAVAAASAAVLLAACSGDDSSSGTAAPVSTAPGSTAPGTAAPSSAPAGSAAPGTGSAGSAASTAAPGKPPAIKLTKVASLDEPIALGLRPGDSSTIYIAERGGRLRTMVGGKLTSSAVLDLSSRTEAGGERGLLGFAFSPDGARLYVNYTDRSGDSNVDELPVAADGTIDAKKRRRVMFQKQPYPNHNGGDLVFGPDGLLYVGFGDGGAGGDPERHAQDLSTWLGKMLRIDPRADGSQPYRVPDDNPFVGTSGAKPEIYAYGLRNPWRYSFDTNGDLWIGDVGQDAIEEIDRAPAADGAGKGANFGWSAFEGDQPYNDDVKAPTDVTPTAPVFTYQHGDQGCSVTGGLVVRGKALPALEGWYLFADYCGHSVRALAPASSGTWRFVDLGGDLPNIVSFGVGPSDEVYALSLGGDVVRIDEA